MQVTRRSNDRFSRPSAEARSNSKFCSTTWMPVGSVSLTSRTLVGSIEAATSVNLTILSPSFKCRTIRWSLTKPMP